LAKQLGLTMEEVMVLQLVWQLAELLVEMSAERLAMMKVIW